MILSRAARAIRNLASAAPKTAASAAMSPVLYGADLGGSYHAANSDRLVTPEVAKTISTAYRCGNILSDDIASMPFQQFRKLGRAVEQVGPDSVTRNIAYLLEIQPNRWMVPFIFKKTVTLWLLYWGNAYIWQPPSAYRELFILPASMVTPTFDGTGRRWYQVYYPNGTIDQLPDVEITHLMINSTDGLSGRSVITYAKETLGRQLAAHETQDKIQGDGLRTNAILWVDGDLKPEARAKMKSAYATEMRDSGVVILDSKIGKFESVTLKPSDAQFLESINATDAEIANFFGMPLYKLNLGKQSYQSNEQQNLDYLRTTLNPYLVQWEQAARVRWLSESEQNSNYFRFVRESLLQTDALTRAQYLEKMILSGQMTPNEARQVNDLSAYEGGDRHYIPANTMQIEQAAQASAVDASITEQGR